MQAAGAGAHGRGRGRGALRAGRRLTGWVAFLLVWLAAAGAEAHRLAPALLELVEREAGVFDVTWKTPREQPVGSRLRPELPEVCREVRGPDAVQEGTGLVVRFTVDCGAEGITGRRLAVRGLASSDSNALARVVWRDGRRVQAVLHPGQAELVLAARQGALSVGREYARLGVGHILSGLDHLLFVFGLLLLATSTRQLVATITCFTLGHSVTLSLAALGFVSFPSAWAELFIALTLVALALELARPPSLRPGLARRAPWAMAGGFGLLHGLGFAGALAEVGLPTGEIPAALFAFNLGIEAGQLVFVAAVLVVRTAFSRPLRDAPPWLVRAPAFAMGGLAVYWCLDRGSQLL